MIKKFCWWVMIGCFWAWAAMPVQAQTTSDEGAAVKLGSGATVKNTIIWGNKGKQLDYSGSLKTTNFIEGINSGDPLFQDADSKDFRLKPASPCINAGTLDALLQDLLDLWGNPRLSGGSYDIGAYEYKTYKISFIKDHEIAIDQLVGGVTYDSTKVEPGGTYRFKPNYTGISGIVKDDIIVKKVEGDEVIQMDADGAYTLGPVNSDVTVQIILTPPTVVTVVPDVHGTLTVTGTKNKTPDGDQNSMVVEENEMVSFDTVSNAGYYCTDVLVQYKEPTGSAWVSVKDKAGKGKVYAVAKSINCKAVFKPASYPVILKVNNAAWGDLKVKNQLSGAETTLSGSATKTIQVVYDAALTFEVAATPKTGYKLVARKVYDADGVTDERELNTGDPARMRVGGITIVASFEPEEYYVRWNCSHGDLTVTGGAGLVGPVEDEGAVKQVKVKYGTEITVTPQPATGYEYVANSLQVTSDGGTAENIDGTKKWTVTRNATLTASFDQKKYLISVSQSGLEGTPADYFTSAPALAADHKVAHGVSLSLTANEPTGYECTGIKLDGVQQAEKTLNISAIAAPHTVEFIFTRVAYTVAYTNETPAYGTLKVEWKGKDVATWTTWASSPQTAYYQDQLRVTVTENPGYELDYLKLNTAAFTSGNTHSVVNNVTILAKFKPKKFKVTLEKVLSSENPDATPNKGKVMVKQGTNPVLSLEKNQNGPVDIMVEYGTGLSVASLCDKGYSLVGITVNGSSGSNDISGTGNFVVQEAVTVKALIKQTTDSYSIHWTVSAPPASNSSFDIKYEDSGVKSSVDQNLTYFAGTSLTFDVNEDSKDQLLYIKDQNGNEIDKDQMYTLNSDVTFEVKFVRKCTVKIVNPAGATVEVRKKDGTVLADGDVVPAGTELETRISKNQPGIGCKTVSVDGVNKWTGTISTTTAPPETSGWIAYTIPENHTGGNVTFSGSAEKFFKVKYASPAFGHLTVSAGGVPLNANTPYWYPQSTVIRIVATEIAGNGYQFNAAHTVENSAPAPSEQIILTSFSGGFENTQNLSKDLDLSTTFEKKKYTVTLVVTHSEGGTVSLSGGDPLLSVQGTTRVVHGNNLTLKATPAVGWAVRLYYQGEVKVKGTTAQQWTTAPITEAVTLKAEFVQRYQVHYGSHIAQVLHEDGTPVGNGGYAYANEVLKAYSSTPAVGKECKQLSVKDFADQTQVIASTTTREADGTIEYSFNMPEKNILVDAEMGLRNFKLAYALSGPAGAGNMVVKKITGGSETPVTVGEKALAYGDLLKVEVTLTPVTAGGSATWYKVKSVSGKMGDGVLSLSPSVAGLVYTYVFTEVVTGDVDLQVELERKQQHLILKVDPANLGFQIKVQVDGNTPVEYAQGYQDVLVPVGAKVEAWAQMPMPAPEGYELVYFPGSGSKETHVVRMMPLDESLSLSLKYALKKFPLNIRVIPAIAGNVVATDASGKTYNNTIGKYSVEYGRNLTEIEVNPANEYYRNTGITAYMGGVDRLQGQMKPYHLDKITDSVGIEARFERLYKVLQDAATNGTFSVTEMGTTTNAVGNMYTEGRSFAVSVSPVDESFECTGVSVSFPGSGLTPVNLPVNAEGKATYTIPAGLVAKDLVFNAAFTRKTFKVALKKTPANGGDAEVWIGAKPAGTLLLNLNRTNPDTELTENAVDYGSVLYFYTAVNTPDFEEVSKKVGDVAYAGAVTLKSDTVFEVRFGRLYTLTFGPNITVWKTDDQSPVSSGDRIAEGVSLTARAELTGHDCMGMTATKGESSYQAWTDTDNDGIVEETFDMPDGNVDVRATFTPKKFKVKIEYDPESRAFDKLQVKITPSDGSASFDVDRENGSLAEYLSKLELKDVQLHPWYEGPISVTAVMKGDPTVYDLQANGLVVKDSVTITAKAHRKQKTLMVRIQQESGATGNQVIVETEDGTQHNFTEDGSLTIDVGAAVEIRTVEAEGCKTVLLSATDGVTTSVTTAPFTLNLANMPDQDVEATARFELKRYPVYFSAGTGGTIVVSKKFSGVDEGVVLNSGDEVKHFTELTIVAEPQSDSYQLKPKGLTVTMGGVTQTEHIASVTGAVNIQADFERIYEVRRLQPEHGTLTVTRADTNAIGSRYPAGTGLKIEAQPEEGYEINALTVNGTELTQTPVQGGTITVNIPDVPTLDSVEFAIKYTLRKYRVKVAAEGEGIVTVSGLAGGDYTVEKTLKERTAEHFTTMTVAVAPSGIPYRVSRFEIHLADGRVLPVAAMDTTIVITGDVTVDVEFKKYYWIEFNTPDHGTLLVRENGTLVQFGDRYPGLTALDIQTQADEGYELEFLTANGAEIVNHTVILPQQDAVYDTLRIEAGYKVKTQLLTVVQPDSGYITVEKQNAAGEWEILDVSSPVTLDYWTQIRVKAGVYNAGGYKVTQLTINETPVQSGDIWTIKGDCRIEARVEPRMYTVNFEHPKYGGFRILMNGEEEIPSGTLVAYRTNLQVTVEVDDPDGYELSWIRMNGTSVENESEWTVLEDVTASAFIKIKRWQVTTTTQGEGALHLYDKNNVYLKTPVDTAEHYTVWQVAPRPADGWMLYRLEVYGPELRSDSTVMVTGEVHIHAEFRQTEPYRFPVAFTPNGDGYNDQWVVEGLWQTRDKNTLEIYDRDQKRVFKASPYNNEWNGETDNGHILPAGNYVYKFTTSTGKVYMGMVSIVRN